MFVSTCMHVYACLGVCVSVCICVFLHVCVCVCKCMHIGMCAFMCLCVCVCMLTRGLTRGSTPRTNLSHGPMTYDLVIFYIRIIQKLFFCNIKFIIFF